MNPQVGNLVLVEPISQKGKNRIREQGNTFFVQKKEDTVPFSPKTGPWFLLGAKNPNHGRWVHLTDDSVWKIVEILG